MNPNKPKACPDCGVPITKMGTRCARCAAIHSIKNNPGRKKRVYKGIKRTWRINSPFHARMTEKYGKAYDE